MAIQQGENVLASLTRLLGPLDESSAQPLYQQLQRVLRSAIENRVIGPDDALPPERDLAEMLAVSRITVRKAIDELVEEGLLIRKQGSGTFVSNRAPDDRLPWRFWAEDGAPATRLTHGSDEFTCDADVAPTPHSQSLDRYAGHYRSYNPWTPSLIAEGVICAVVAGTAGGIIGGWIGRAVVPDAAAECLPRWLMPAAGVAAVAVIAWAMPMPNGSVPRASVTLTEVAPPP